MKTLKRLAAVSVLITSAFAQTPGFFISAGGGYAKVQAESFSLTTSYGEVLHSTSGDDSVTFANIELGWRFNTNWALGLGYADYGTAELNVSFPKYSGFVSVLPFPDYSRNVLIYESHQFELVPAYSHPIGERWTLHARAGATYRETTAHFETTYYQSLSGPPSGNVSQTFPEEKTTTWSYLVSVGVEFEVTPRFSIGLMGTYSPSKMKLPGEKIAGIGNTWVTPSKSEIDVDYFEVAISIGWR
ncbi:MAG: TonB-dependent receptor [Nibricoccus sp.]